MLAGGAKCRAGDGGDTCVLQENAAYLLSAGAGAANVDPGVESAFRRLAVKAGNLVQIVNKLIAAAGEFRDHARGISLAIAKRFDGGILGEFGDAGVAV